MMQSNINQKQTYQSQVALKLYLRYGPMVYRRCVNLLKDEHKARRALKNTFEKYFLATSVSGGGAGALYRIATEECNAGTLKPSTDNAADFFADAFSFDFSKVDLPGEVSVVDNPAAWSLANPAGSSSLFELSSRQEPMFESRKNNRPALLRKTALPKKNRPLSRKEALEEDKSYEREVLSKREVLFQYNGLPNGSLL